MQHISGDKNLLADTLTRLEGIALLAVISFEKVFIAQQQDEKLETLLIQPISAYSVAYISGKQGPLTDLRRRSY